MTIKTIKVLIVEDEEHNRRLLSGMIRQLRPQWTVADVTESVAETIEWLQNNTADIIFMDIQLADGICFSIFEKVTIDTPIVFTTAYDNYAIRAFKVNSIDYLLKPLKEEDLRSAIEKFEKQLSTKASDLNFNELMNAVLQGVKKFRTRFLVHGTKAYYKIDVEQIAYFYSSNKITFARLFDKTDHILDASLESIEDEIDPERYFRAGRNIIVNINAVVSFEDYFGGKLILRLNPPFEEQVTVSRLKNTAFKQWLGK
ncbi:MAG TPA: LytTR family DNA-binding domain-containing protein [Salinivirgaceae bacterium]|nr:LytTR family DNA-binding domain-containing protein [Salinivirgaceae bacterium]